MKPALLNRTGRDVQIAVRTLVLCTVVYLGAAIWIIFSVRNTSFVADADNFCLNHISRYCE